MKEIFEAAKQGPAITGAIILSSVCGLVITFVGFSTAIAPLVGVVVFFPFLIGYRRFLEPIPVLNRNWLRWIKNHQALFQMQITDLQSQGEGQSFLLSFYLTNVGYTSFANYRVELMIPRRILPSGTKQGPEVTARSTSTHICLRLPSPMEKSPPPITDTSPRNIILNCYLPKGALTKDLLSLRVSFEVLLDDLIIEKRSRPLSDLLDTEQSKELTISGLKNV